MMSIHAGEITSWHRKTGWGKLGNGQAWQLILSGTSAVWLLGNGKMSEAGFVLELVATVIRRDILVGGSRQSRPGLEIWQDLAT